jgi:hypothetical protein
MRQTNAFRIEAPDGQPVLGAESPAMILSRRAADKLDAYRSSSAPAFLTLMEKTGRPESAAYHNAITEP